MARKSKKNEPTIKDILELIINGVIAIAALIDALKS